MKITIERIDNRIEIDLHDSLYDTFELIGMLELAQMTLASGSAKILKSPGEVNEHPELLEG